MHTPCWTDLVRKEWMWLNVWVFFFVLLKKRRRNNQTECGLCGFLCALLASMFLMWINFLLCLIAFFCSILHLVGFFCPRPSDRFLALCFKSQLLWEENCTEKSQDLSQWPQNHELAWVCRQREKGREWDGESDTDDCWWDDIRLQQRWTMQTGREKEKKEVCLLWDSWEESICRPPGWLSLFPAVQRCIVSLPYSTPRPPFFLFPLPSFSPTLPQINPLPLPSSFSLLWSLCFLCMQTLLFSCNNIKNPPASSIPGSLNPTSTWEQLNTLSPALIFLFMMGGSKGLVSCSHQTIRGFIKINRFINKLVGLTACFQPLSKYFSSALLPEPWCSMCGSSGVDVLADCLDHLLLTKPSSVHLFYHNHCKHFPLCC